MLKLDRAPRFKLMTPLRAVTKVLVINPNNWYNKGDVSNRLGLIKALREEFGDKIAVTIETLTPREDERYFGKYGANVAESIFSNNAGKEPSYPFVLITKIRNMLHFMICLLMHRVFRYEPFLHHKCHIFLHSLLDSDIIISSPGGFLQDYSIFSSLIPNIFLLFSAKALGKPVLIYAQSIGPFRNKILRFLCKLILNTVDVIILREDISRCYLDEANINRPKIFITADATFSVTPPQYNKNLHSQDLLNSFRAGAYDGDTIIGITVLGEYFSSQKRRKLLKKYVKGVALAVDHVIDRLNAKVIFIPQVSTGSEIAAMHLIARSIKNKNHVVIIREDFSPEEVMKLIGCMDLFVGTRMHSNIFALIMNVPLIAIAYEHKTYGIMKMLGLENWVIDVEDVYEHKLALKIDELHRNRFEIKKKILAAIEKVRGKSLSSAKIVRAWYEDYQMKMMNA